MSAGAIHFITYLWHYLVARMLYDQLLRPLIHGDASNALLVAAVGAACFAAGRMSGRRSLRAATEAARRRSG